MATDEEIEKLVEADTLKPEEKKKTTIDISDDWEATIEFVDEQMEENNG